MTPWNSQGGRQRRRTTGAAAADGSAPRAPSRSHGMLHAAYCMLHSSATPPWLAALVCKAGLGVSERCMAPAPGQFGLTSQPAARTWRLHDGHDPMHALRPPGLKPTRPHRDKQQSAYSPACRTTRAILRLSVCTSRPSQSAQPPCETTPCVCPWPVDLDANNSLARLQYNPSEIPHFPKCKLAFPFFGLISLPLPLPWPSSHTPPTPSHLHRPQHTRGLRRVRLLRLLHLHGRARLP